MAKLGSVRFVLEAPALEWMQAQQERWESAEEALRQIRAWLVGMACDDDYAMGLIDAHFAKFGPNRKEQAE